jgi:thiamine biosynthesis lipoprotein
MTGTSAEAAIREIRFPAMGSDVHVIVVGGASDLASAARARIDQLEARWSRFLPDSELSRLNRLPGRPVIVSNDTLTGVIAAVDAWKATHGRFDPTVLPALVAAGYDRSFAILNQDHEANADAPPGAAPGCADIEIDAAVHSVTLPIGTQIDLGGIGKGLAADLVVDELLDAGASGACVNIGGDLRVRGTAPGSDGWIVGVEHLPDLRIALADGGVVPVTPSTICSIPASGRRPPA